MEQKSAARLPRGARPPFRVWVNGIEQREGEDYVVRADRLVFNKFLAKEGRLGPWRWTMMLLGIHGTYRKNDSVDVQYEVNGRTRLVSALELEPVGGASSETPPARSH
jgi:hypothetical protein